MEVKTMKKTGKIVAIAITGVLFLSGMLGVYANGGGDPGGCTPGYWKNHLDAWIPTGLDPSDEVDEVFIVPYTDIENKTLLQLTLFLNFYKQYYNYFFIITAFLLAF